MIILVVGASGATGHLLVKALLSRGLRVRVVVRSAARFHERVPMQAGLEVVEASLLDLSEAELAGLVRGCSAVASCLGHNLTLRGVFGRPRRLVTEAAARLCRAVEAESKAAGSEELGRGANGFVKFVLMSSTGVRDRDAHERVSLAERFVIALVRLLVPPHSDNEQAVEVLRRQASQSQDALRWVAVRPDALVDAAAVTPTSVHPSPTRSAIFNSGKTSRVNVADFMARLIVDDSLFATWQGRMPVIYNTVEAAKAESTKA